MHWNVSHSESAYGPGMSKLVARERFDSLESAKEFFLSCVSTMHDCRIFLTERDGQYSRSIMEAKVN